jgi:hypothetical protein
VFASVFQHVSPRFAANFSLRRLTLGASEGAGASIHRGARLSI